MQMGQAGLLSFGHAILFGLGGYCTAHALNAVKAGAIWLPIELVPLIGGLGGLGFGVVFGFVATKQRATAFAMITLGLGELVAAAALMFMGFFGGEGGISTNRVTGSQPARRQPTAPSWQVYYLIVAWALICDRADAAADADAARTHCQRQPATTSSGPSSSATTRAWCASTSTSCRASSPASPAPSTPSSTRSSRSMPCPLAKSATALLATYIGGVGGFFGPILGAILIVLLQSGVSLLVNAWLLYVGVLFIVMVMFAPGGIVGPHRHARARLPAAAGCGDLVVPYLRVLVPGLIFICGFVLMVEMASFVDDRRTAGQVLQVGRRHAIDPRRHCRHGCWPRQCSWAAAIWLRAGVARFARVWDAPERGSQGSRARPA